MNNIILSSVTTEHFIMEYATFGNGIKPLIIIPGVSMKSVLPSASAIAEQYSRFSKTHTIFLFDRKKEIRPGYSVVQMAEDTAEAMKCLGIRKADIFGASQGGMIAEVIAARHHDLVDRLLLGATLAVQNDTSIRTFTEWIRFADEGNPERLNRSVFRKIYSEDYYRKYENIFEDLEKQGTPEDLTRFGILVRACLRFDLRAEIKNIVCPVLAIGGTEDRVLSGEATNQIGKMCKAETKLILGQGHALYDESPVFLDFMQQYFD